MKYPFKKEEHRNPYPRFQFISQDYEFGFLSEGAPQDVQALREPTFIELEEPRGTTIVDMSTFHSARVPKGETAKAGSTGFAGCTGIAYTAVHNNGDRSLFLQHADPFQVSLWNHYPAPLSAIKAQPEGGKAVIMAPGILGRPIPLEQLKHELNMFSQPEILGLAERLGSIVGEQVTIVPYRPVICDGMNAYRQTILIDIPPEGPGTIQADCYFRF